MSAYSEYPCGAGATRAVEGVWPRHYKKISSDNVEKAGCPEINKEVQQCNGGSAACLIVA